MTKRVARYYGTGKRKTSIARVYMKAGSGVVIVNKKSFDDYFCRETLKTLAVQPLELTSNRTNFDIYANITGGGMSGQAGAMRHGIARALLEMNADLRAPLRKAGFLTRDSRIKERKKYGQPGARKRFQFSKR
ncbi:MAG: 30S ribosomal protein S9 [Deltaproteobacteria bacterium]|nr:30S ribosomal protein S9 [Deltaproteobacteria bacterium]